MLTPAEVRAARTAYGITAAEMADVLGVSERTVRRWESGETPATGQVAERLRALDSRVDQIADHIAARWRAAGCWEVDLADVDGPPGLVRVAAWRAHLLAGVRFTD